MEYLIRTLTPDDAQIRVYPSSIALNAAACRLLGIEQGDRVSFRTRTDIGMRVIYIGKSNNSIGVRLKSQKGRNGGYIYSSAVSGALADALQGCGCYRICHETPVQEDGTTLYEIFFKKFANG